MDNGEGGLRVNPLSCFFTSFYDDPKSLDLVQFLAYFPSAEALTDQKEFDALKASEYFPFDADITLEDMPVPVHKISAQAIDEVLQRYAGISLSECEDAGKSAASCSIWMSTMLIITLPVTLPRDIFLVLAVKSKGNISSCTQIIVCLLCANLVKTILSNPFSPFKRAHNSILQTF